MRGVTDRRPIPSEYARYIGRVGALAVALGVGAAILHHPGAAWADDTGSSSSSDGTSSASGSSSLDSSPEGASTPKAADSGSATAKPADPPATPETTTSKTDSSTTTSTSTEDGPVVTVSSSGGALTSTLRKQKPKTAADETASEAPTTTKPASTPAVLTAAVTTDTTSPDDTPAPAAPVEPPVSLAALAWTRRQAQAPSIASANRVATTASDNSAPEFTDYPHYDYPGDDAVVHGYVTAEDPDGDTVTFSGSTTTSKGSAVVNTDGTFTYTPTTEARVAAGTLGAEPAGLTSDAFTIRATDDFGNSNSTDVRVPIRPIYREANSDPIFGGPPVTDTPGADGVVSGHVTATDPDGDALSYYLGSTPAKGTVVVNADGTFTYTPTADARHAAAAINAAAATKQDTFTITVDDGYGGSSSTTVTVPVAALNTAPVAGTPTVSTPTAAGVVGGRVNVVDAEGDSIVVTGSTNTGRGTVVVNPDGTFTYTPTAAARHTASTVGAPLGATQDVFTVRIDDGHGGVVIKQVVVPISPANDAPITVGGAPGTPASGSGAVTGTVRFVDPNNDALAYSITAHPTKGTLVLYPNGTYAYTPYLSSRLAAANPFASSSVRKDSFVVTADDGHGGRTTTVVTVAVAAPTGGGGSGTGAAAQQSNESKANTVAAQSSATAVEAMLTQQTTKAVSNMLLMLQQQQAAAVAAGNQSLADAYGQMIAATKVSQSTTTQTMTISQVLAAVSATPNAKTTTQMGLTASQTVEDDSQKILADMLKTQSDALDRLNAIMQSMNDAQKNILTNMR